MGRRRHGGRAIGPRLSRVTKAAGARPPAGAGRRLTGINQVGERARGAGCAGSRRGWWGRAAPRRAGGRARKTREVRKRGEGGAVGKAPTRPTGTTPAARMPDRGHNPRSTRDAARRAPPRGGTRGGGTAGPLSSSAPRPRREPARPGGPGSRAGETPGPGHAGDRPTRPQAPVRPRPPQRGGGRRAARTRRPARGRQTGRPDPRSGERAGAGGAAGVVVGGGLGAAGAPPRPARDDVGRQAAAAKRATDRGRGRPGEARHTRARPREAADGERTEAGGRADGEGHRRGAATRDTNATEPAVEAGVGRAPPRGGMARNDPGGGVGGGESAARAHRGISPPEASQHRGGPGAHTQNDRLASPGHTHTHPTPAGGDGGAPPSRGLTPTATLHPEPRPTRENALPPRLRGHCSTRGRHRLTVAGRRHPREARPARSQTAGNGGGRGHRRSHARGEEEGRQRWGGAGKHAQQGPRDGGEGAARGPENTGTQPGHQENQRRIPPPPTQEGGPATPGTPAIPGHPWSGPHTPAPPPGPACRPNPSFSSIHPSVRPPQIRVFHQKSDPEAQHPGDTLSSEGGPDRAHNTATGCGSGRGQARQAPHPPHHGCGAGGAGADQAKSHPKPPPFPLGSHHGAGRTHTAHAQPPTRRTPGGAQRGPPPTRRGEARAAVGIKQAHGPTAGPAHPSPPLPTEGKGSFCPRALAVATVATAHSGGAAAGGSGRAVPHPVVSPSGPTEAHQEPPVLNWAGGEGVCGIGKRTTTQGRVCGQGRGRARAPQPPTTGGAHNEASLTASTPPTGHTHTTVAGTRGGHRVKGKHHRSASGT
ncbi:collagen alpha-1(I) chain-like [Muntiacus reevesi]|uniref:collagen alpha-1(I) chain-like n=1 Tax=Muntiacus reevesi TaxID=9886 RepID=UPI0033078D22